MRYRPTALRLLAGLALVTALASPASAKGVSIRAYGAQQLRVQTIGYRLAAANARYCAQPRMMTGLLLHDLSQYPQGDRAAIAAAFSMTGGFGILGLVPGSVAARAGLQVDDEIVAVNGRSVEDARRAIGDRQSYGRTGRFSDLLGTSLKQGPAHLLVRRKGALLEVKLAGQPGCGGDAVLQQSGQVNAWSDGKFVVVTTGIAAFADSDDEISFIVAHEMAHNILGHNNRRAPSALLEMLGFGTAGLRRDETAADGFAVQLMDGAGYRPESAVTLLETARRRLWWEDLSLSHPSFSARIRIVSAAMSKLPRRSVPGYGQVEIAATSPTALFPSPLAQTSASLAPAAAFLAAKR